MLDIIFTQKIVFAALIGALLGLEREYANKKGVIGVRTFALISILGALCVFLSEEMVKNPIIMLIGFVLTCVFALGFYSVGFMKKRAKGFTTSVAIILAYLLGVMSGYGLFYESLFLCIIIALILFSKEKLHDLVVHLTEKEIGDLLEFLVILGIIYPLIPAEFVAYGIKIPLMTMWVLVVMISMINFAAFILSRKMAANHEIELISFLGGLVSSTATTISSLDIYKQNKKTLTAMSGGFLLMNAASFARNMLLLIVVAPEAGAIALIPALICIGILVFSGIRMTRMKVKTKKLSIDSPFNVKRGVKLAAAIAAIFILLGFVNLSDTKLLVIFSFFGGLAETTATLISLMSMHQSASITAKVLAAAAVTAQMGGYAGNFMICKLYGGKQILKKTMFPFALAITGTFISFLILLFL